MYGASNPACTGPAQLVTTQSKDQMMEEVGLCALAAKAFEGQRKRTLYRPARHVPVPTAQPRRRMHTGQPSNALDAPGKHVHARLFGLRRAGEQGIVPEGGRGKYVENIGDKSGTPCLAGWPNIACRLLL